MSSEVFTIRVTFGNLVQAVRVRRDEAGQVFAYLAGPPEGWTAEELRAVADEMERHERKK